MIAPGINRVMFPVAHRHTENADEEKPTFSVAFQVWRNGECSNFCSVQWFPSGGVPVALPEMLSLISSRAGWQEGETVGNCNTLEWYGVTFVTSLTGNPLFWTGVLVMSRG